MGLMGPMAPRWPHDIPFLAQDTQDTQGGQDTQDTHDIPTIPKMAQDIYIPFFYVLRMLAKDLSQHTHILNVTLETW